MAKRAFKMMRSVLTLLLAFSMIVPSVTGKAENASKGVVILYTNDVHCGMDDYAELAAYKTSLQEDGYEVSLVDAGDAIQGEVIGTLTEGEAIVDLMNLTGYDYAVPGNREFDYGVDRLLELAEEKAEYTYLCSNFMDIVNAKTVFEPYRIVTLNGEKVAFLGIITPETYTSTAASNFQDEAGNYIYSFSEKAFFDTIQTNINAAIADGAQRIVAIGHLGISGSREGWTSTDVIANTTGIDMFIDAHSHETIASATYSDKEGNEVMLSSTGTKLANIGQLTIASDGTMSAQLVQPSTIVYEQLSEKAKASYDKVQTAIDGYKEELAYLQEELGSSETKLVVVGDDGSRIVRFKETNMGDFAADAYRSVLSADIAFVNGGGLRATIEKGTVTRRSLMDVNPWNNTMCKVKLTGQQILDALEHSFSEYPKEFGGFLQVSGVTYEVNVWKESPVIKDDKENFVRVDDTKERRVFNVKVNGTPIVPEQFYTVAGSEFFLCSGGDGYAMFTGAEVIKTDETFVDAQVLGKYLVENLKGTITAAQYGNPDGDGRIVIHAEESSKEESSESKSFPKKNTILKHKKSQGKYKVTKAGLTGGTVSYVGPSKKTLKKITIPATIKVDGITYKVTGIAKKAFSGCKKVKTITVKATYLKKSKIEKKAWQGIGKKTTVKVPKKKYKSYKKMFRAKGLGKKVKVKKI